MTLDDHLPRYHFNEVHSIRIDRPPEVVLAAARELTGREVPLMGGLMLLRAGPRALRLSARRTVLEEFERAGFTKLEDGPDRIVAGAVGRFWRPSGGLLQMDPERFAAFSDPGYAKAAFEFRAAPSPDGGGTLLTTETRILATDETARRSFGRYWRVIRPGSGAIRWAWLRAIARRARRA